MAEQTLAFNVLAKDNASRTFDRIGGSAERVATRVDKSNTRMGAGFSKFGRALEKDVGFRVDKAHNGLALLSNFVSGPFGNALMIGVVASDTISTALSIVSIQNLKAAASWVIHKTALVATTIATKAMTIATRALGFAMMIATGPVGLIILGIAALAIGLVIAYKKSETFRNIVNAVFRVVWGTIKTVWNWIKQNWPLLLGILTGPIGLATILIIRNWRKIWDGLKSLVGNIRNFFQDLPGNIRHWVGNLGRLLYNQGRHLITGLWNGIKAIWSSTIAWFKDLPSKILSALGIHSPPDWAIDAGRHIMAGLLKGMIPGGKDLLAFGKNVVAGLSATMGGAQIRFGGGGGAIQGSPMQIAQRMVPEWATGAQWRAWYDLWMNESGWNPLADNPTSTAFGIPQFIASTARAYGVYGSTDPARQIAAGAQYIADRYGDPIHAWAHWTRHHSYDAGGIASGAGMWGKRTLAPERVLSPAQTRSFDRLVRVLDRGGSAGIINVTINTGGVVGMTKMDLENALVSTINRVAGQGRLDRAVRVAAR